MLHLPGKLVYDDSSATKRGEDSVIDYTLPVTKRGEDSVIDYTLPVTKRDADNVEKRGNGANTL